MESLILNIIKLFTKPVSSHKITDITGNRIPIPQYIRTKWNYQ